MTIVRIAQLLPSADEALLDEVFPLHLVDDDEAGEGAEREDGVSQESEILRTLQVERRYPGAPVTDELPCQRGLPNLAWAEDRHDRELT